MKTIQTLIFFNRDNMKSIDTQYFLPTEAKNFIKHIETHSFSALHINIRSLSKNFENFKTLLSTLHIEFKLICVTETWSQEDQVSLFRLPGYSFIHKKSGKIKGVFIIINCVVSYKVRTDLSMENGDIESLCVEIMNKKHKNIIVNTLYRPTTGKIKPFKSSLKDVIANNYKTSKTMYLIGDFNLIRITKTSATAIDDIVTNSFIETKLTTGIIKADVSDHFPILLVCQKQSVTKYNEKITIKKGLINNDSISAFKNMLNETNWKI